MRAMYKALDDFPQRFRQRHGNYARMTVTHTHMDRVRGRFIDPDVNKLLGKVHQRLCIVEMRDRDLSLFHRGQLITGDKGEDVWDHENDRPLLDTHRGFHEQPLGVQVDEKLQEQEDRVCVAASGSLAPPGWCWHRGARLLVWHPHLGGNLGELHKLNVNLLSVDNTEHSVALLVWCPQYTHMHIQSPRKLV